MAVAITAENYGRKQRKKTIAAVVDEANQRSAAMAVAITVENYGRKQENNEVAAVVVETN